MTMDNITNLSFPSVHNETRRLPLDNSMMAINVFLDLFSPILKCEWLPFHHISFHIANFLILISLLSPNNIYGILWLRLFTMTGTSLMVFWGLLIFCSRDFAVWNALFTIVNMVQVFLIGMCKMYYSAKFPSFVENAYFRLFVPLKVSRRQFRKIFNCKYEIKTYHSGMTYAIEDFTKIETLGLVLCGRFKVSRRSKVLHFASTYSFLDSPEWFYATSNDYYQVSMTATEDSEVLIWNKDKLKLSIYGDRFLQEVLEHVLSKDALNKLLNLTNIYIDCVDHSNNIASDIPNIKDDIDSSKLLVKECKLKSTVPIYYNYISDTDRLEDNEHLSAQDEDYEWDLSQIKEEYETAL